MGATPEWGEVLKVHIQKALLELHSAMPGEVVSYNAQKQTATVKPLLKWQKFLPGRALKQVFDVKPLPDVLVCHPRAGSKGMHLPLASGDLVLLIFCDRSITAWRGQGAASTPSDPGTYDVMPLSGALALPLMHHDSAAWSGSIVDGSTVNIGESGGAFEAVALAQKALTEMNKIRSAFNSHIHNTTATVGTGPVGTITGPNPTIGALSAPAAQNVRAS